MECGYKGLLFCRQNGWIMENMDKELTVPKWVLIVWPKNTPNAPEFIFPAQAQMKKASLGVRSPWLWYIYDVKKINIYFELSCMRIHHEAMLTARAHVDRHSWDTCSIRCWKRKKTHIKIQFSILLVLFLNIVMCEGFHGCSGFVFIEE